MELKERVEKSKVEANAAINALIVARAHLIELQKLAGGEGHVRDALAHVEENFITGEHGAIGEMQRFIKYLESL